MVGPDVHQKGSNITDERMRFDFSCDHKLSDEEKIETENLVNKWIQEGLDVSFQEMTKEDAIKSGAECMFIEKYPDIVTVYTIGVMFLKNYAEVRMLKILVNLDTLKLQKKKHQVQV